MRKLFFLAALLLFAPLAIRAQVYPAPPNVGLAAARPVNCVASNPGQPQEPQWYFATDTSVLSICVATNTWQNTTGGGGGGGIGGGGTTGFLGEWTNATTIQNSLCQDVSSVLICGESISVGANAYMISKPNSASGTTQFLAVAWDSSRNAITAVPGNSVRGIAGLGAGTSGTVQIAIGGEYPWTCDNQTTVNDWLILSSTVNGECHDAGATEPTGVQNIAQVAGANGGAGTATLADIFTPDTVNAPDGRGTTLQVNTVPVPGTSANLNGTTPAAGANQTNLTWQADSSTPTTNVSVEVPQATTGQEGIVQLAGDVGNGTAASPTVTGIQTIPVTFTSPAANDLICFPTTSTLANCKFGVPVRTYSTGSDTILATDRTKWIVPTTSGTIATTLPQANSAGFTSNFVFATLNHATGADTITPTTSTINGNATLVVPPNWFAQTTSDNTNYFAAMMPTGDAFPTCTDTGGNHLNISAAKVITCGTSSSSSGVTSIATTSPITGGTITTTGTIACATCLTSAAGGSAIRVFGTTFGDTGGSALTAGSTVYFTIPYACTIAGWNINVDAGTATVDVWKLATGTANPTVSNTITASAIPAISTGTAIHSTTLTGWTTSVAANDIFGINLKIVSTAKFVALTLQCNQ